MSLAIIIPAYKESDNIKNLIKAILKEVGDPTIFIIDDSPNKNTEKEIERNIKNIKTIQNVILTWYYRKLEVISYWLS